VRAKRKLRRQERKRKSRKRRLPKALNFLLNRKVETFINTVMIKPSYPDHEFAVKRFVGKTGGTFQPPSVPIYKTVIRRTFNSAVQDNVLGRTPSFYIETEMEYHPIIKLNFERDLDEYKFARNRGNSIAFRSLVANELRRQYKKYEKSVSKLRVAKEWMLKNDIFDKLHNWRKKVFERYLYRVEEELEKAVECFIPYAGKHKNSKYAPDTYWSKYRERVDMRDDEKEALRITVAGIISAEGRLARRIYRRLENLFEDARAPELTVAWVLKAVKIFIMGMRMRSGELVIDWLNKMFNENIHRTRYVLGLIVAGHIWSVFTEEEVEGMLQEFGELINKSVPFKVHSPLWEKGQFWTELDRIRRNYHPNDLKFGDGSNNEANAGSGLGDGYCTAMIGIVMLMTGGSFTSEDNFAWVVFELMRELFEYGGDFDELFGFGDDWMIIGDVNEDKDFWDKTDVPIILGVHIFKNHSLALTLCRDDADAAEGFSDLNDLINVDNTRISTIDERIAYMIMHGNSDVYGAIELLGELDFPGGMSKQTWIKKRLPKAKRYEECKKEEENKREELWIKKYIYK